MAQRLQSSIASRRSPPVRLVAVDGEIVLPETHERVAPIDRPEARVEVAFEGLTESEQRAALANFPGGRRFVLKPGR